MANTNRERTIRFAAGVCRETRASFLEIEAWMPSEIKAVPPLVHRLTRLIERFRCVAGDEPAVELALDEALDNADEPNERD
jgi:hypothetical protein